MIPFPIPLRFAGGKPCEFNLLCAGMWEEKRILATVVLVVGLVLEHCLSETTYEHRCKA